jgi:hypothetical protein
VIGALCERPVSAVGGIMGVHKDTPASVNSGGATHERCTS